MMLRQMIDKTTSLVPGIFIVFLLTWVSMLITHLPIIATTGISPLVFAILIGIIVANIVSLPHVLSPGIQFSAKRILRLAIVLYGFRISVQQMVTVGWTGLWLDLFVVSSTLGFGYIIGRKIFKLDAALAVLISVGAAICGAAAVLAVEDVLKSPPHKAVVGVGTVVLFGTISMLLYPFLHHMHLLGLTDAQFGLFAGGSIHEVAQVLVAGADISPEVAKTAVIVKMMRVLLLVPAILVISYFYQRAHAIKDQKFKLVVPWFAVGFIIMIIVNSLTHFSPQTVAEINNIDTFLLTMAMGAIGLETKWAKVKHVGLMPLYFATSLFLWLLASVSLAAHFT